jgi:hypothetical protein
MSSVRAFGARGDGKTDDTAAITHAIQDGNGSVVFPPGEYLISRPLLIPLDRRGPLSVQGRGGTARLIMAGAGPALDIVGTHRKTAHPSDFAESVWRKERMPTIRGLEIVGRHAEADGVRIEGAMQPTLQDLLIRRCRHGIHLVNRKRNVIIADCHVYDNRGIGIYLDHVNLHQINVHGNHISYCKQGGIKVVASEIRNLQICSNDIEYNYDAKADASADVCFDCREGTVREGTIVGNTIQAVLSPGGANVRLLGLGKDNPNAVGLFAITGNLIGSQQTALHLQACRGVVLSGNSIYSGYRHAILAEDAEHLIIGPNSIDHNPQYKGPSTDAVLLRACRNVTITGLLLQHTRAADEEVGASMELRECRQVSMTGCQIINARVRGVWVRSSSVVRLADCTVLGAKDDKSYRAAVRVDDTCTHVLVCNSFLGKGSDGELELPRGAGEATGNVSL